MSEDALATIRIAVWVVVLIGGAMIAAQMLQSCARIMTL